MPKRSKTKETPVEEKKKNPAAVALGRLGGLKGGRARAAKLSDVRRSEIAKLAVTKREQLRQESESRSVSQNADLKMKT